MRLPLPTHTFMRVPRAASGAGGARLYKRRPRGAGRDSGRFRDLRVVGSAIGGSHHCGTGSVGAGAGEGRA
jgi:hypothetical protein